jgi:hypothetical protein
MGKDHGLHRNTSLSFSGPDRGREGVTLPALRTVRAVLPHTALQLVVSSSGLARQRPGFGHGEKPGRSEVRIGPAEMVTKTVTRPRTFLLFAQQRP